MFALIAAIAAVGCAIVLAFSALADRWTGEDAGAGMRWRGFGGKRGMPASHYGRLRVAIDVATALDFEVRREGSFDRLGKRLGLVSEIQSGHPAFDDACFLVADRPEVRVLLQGHHQLPPLLADLRFGWQHYFYFQRLVCRRGELYVDLCTAVAIGSGSRELNDVLVQGEQRLRDIAALLPPGTGARGGDPLVLRSMLLLAVSGGLFVAGMVSGGAEFAAAPELLLDPGSWTRSLPFAMIAWGILLLASFRLVGKSSRTHVVLLEVLFFGGLGLVLLAHGMLMGN
jgi:hypothetical protein